MNSIILFYKYVDISNPHAILKWQKQLCSKLQLKGRVILGHEGINGTLGGNREHINAYKQEMLSHPLFEHIDFKETLNTHDHFPRLRVVIKKEIVYLGLDTQAIRAENGGKHLEPAQAHELIAKNPSDLVIIDCRNQVESAIGTMPQAVRPDVKRFREFPTYVDQHVDDFKDKQVLMYCTGGIRCERASAYIKSKNVAKEVYQIKGGIHRYIEQFPNGFFRGKNYVFDGRTAVKVTDDILGSCYICNIPCDDYSNCLRADCNRHFICCVTCLQTYANTCSNNCYDLVHKQNALKRPKHCTIYNDSCSTV